MVKGGKKTNIGYVYGVMEELQRLRESVASLTEKNRDLAKQLNVTKMELARERKQLQAMVVDHVKMWTKKQERSMPTMCDASTQCDLFPRETSSDNTTTVTSHDTPPRRYVASPHDARRSLSPTIKIVRRELLLVEARPSPNRHAQTPAEEDDVYMHTPSPIQSAETQTSPDLALEAEDTVARSLAPQFEMHRRLRHRTHDIIYVEPPLNRKIRRGDYYGFIKRPRNISPRPHMKPKRRLSSNHTSAIMSLAPPLPTKRLTRPRQPVSYVLPKLNTKLRQGDRFTFTT